MLAVANRGLIPFVRGTERQKSQVVYELAGQLVGTKFSDRAPCDLSRAVGRCPTDNVEGE